MHIPKHSTISAGLLAVIVVASGTVHAQATPYKLGATIPAGLTFTAADGNVHTFGEFRGKPVVLEWTNPECPFVQKHYTSGNMTNLQKAATANNTIWITINSGAKGKQGYLNPQTAAQDVEKLGYHSTYVVPDSDGKLGRLFGAEKTPHMYLLNAQGKLVYMGAIDSIPSFDPADIAKSENYISAALTELAAGKAITTPQTNAYGCSIKY